MESRVNTGSVHEHIAVVAADAHEMRQRAKQQNAAPFGRAQLMVSSIKFTEPEQKLGTGASADVLHGTITVGRQTRPSALKVFRGSMGMKLTDAMFQQIQKEVEVGWRIQHENLVKTFGIVEHPLRGLVVVMEYADGGTLHHKILETTDVYPIETVVKWLSETATGLRVLHTMLPQILHCDLKPQNILLDSKGVAKVSDFGLAKANTAITCMTGSSTNAGKGTLGYKPPETYSGKSWTAAGDIFSLGMVIYYVLSGKQPFEGEAESSIMGKMHILAFEVDEEQLEEDGISEEKQRKRWQKKMAKSFAVRRPDLKHVRDDCPKRLHELMVQCWLDHADSRPSSSTIADAVDEISFLSELKTIESMVAETTLAEQQAKIDEQQAELDQQTAALAEGKLTMERERDRMAAEMAATAAAAAEDAVRQRRLKVVADSIAMSKIDTAKKALAKQKVLLEVATADEVKAAVKRATEVERQRHLRGALAEEAAGKAKLDALLGDLLEVAVERSPAGHAASAVNRVKYEERASRRSLPAGNSANNEDCSSRRSLPSTPRRLNSSSVPPPPTTPHSFFRKVLQVERDRMQMQRVTAVEEAGAAAPSAVKGTTVVHEVGHQQNLKVVLLYAEQVQFGSEQIAAEEPQEKEKAALAADEQRTEQLEHTCAVRKLLSLPQLDLQKRLCAAVIEGNAGMVRKLLVEEGADPSVAGPDDPAFPPLFLATWKGNAGVVKVLLDHNADPTKAIKQDGASIIPVMAATVGGHTAVIELLKAHSADLPTTKMQRMQKQLCAAVEGNEIEVLRKLLAESGADPSLAGPNDPTRPPVYLAAWKCNAGAVKVLLEHNADPNQAKTDDGCTPLFTASFYGNVAIAKLLAENNADVNQSRTTDGTTPLFAAVRNGHRDLIKVLLDHNANPNQARTDNGATPLHAAAKKGDFEGAGLLLKNNADPNQATPGTGLTPLFVAAQEGRIAVADLLLKNTADPNQAETNIGATPLFMAAQEGHLAIAELLLKNNADPNKSLATAGRTPLKRATKKGHTAVAALLKEYGAV